MILSNKLKIILRMVLALFASSILLVCLFFLADVIAVIKTTAEGADTGNCADTALAFISSHADLCSFLIYLAAIPFVYINCCKKIDRPTEKETRIYRYLLLVPVGAAIALLLNAAVSLVSCFIPSEAFYGDAASIYTGILPVDLFAVALLPALLEELIYRGTIHSGMKYFFPKWAAVVLSAVIFALMHSSSAQAVYAGILGLILACVYEHYGHLLAPVILHFSANAFSVAGMDWQPLKNALATTSGVVVMIAASVAVTAVFVLLTFREKQLFPKQSLTEKTVRWHA